MQNQNIWTDSYSSPEYSGKCWNTGENPGNDEVDSSYTMNPASLPAGLKNETFTDCGSDIVSPTSIHNIATVTNSSTVPSSSSVTGTVENNNYSGMFSNSSSFIESEHSSLLSGIDESSLNQINGQIQSETIPSSELSNKQDETVSSLPSIQRCSKRRNSLPSDYPNYKRRLSLDYEVQSLCGVDTGTDSNSSCDVKEHGGNEDDSWTNCYAPYRKRPTSVVSSERGAESLINKLFNDEQRKRYEALRKSSTKRMDRKRRKDKSVDFGVVYKSFVEGITHSSHQDSIVNEGETMIHESTSDSYTVHGVEADDESKDSHQIMFTTDSIPEETDTDLISESDNLSVDEVSLRETVPMDYDAVDDSSNNALIQISSSNDSTFHRVSSDVVDDNSKDFHPNMHATDSIPEEISTDLISESDNISLGAVSQQDTVPMDYNAMDDTSDNILVQISSSNINDDNSKDSQGIPSTDFIPEETSTDLISESDSLSVNMVCNKQDIISMNYDTVDNGHTSANIFAQISSSDDSAIHKVCIDDDNSKDSHRGISATDSMPERTDADLISESDSLSVNQQDALSMDCVDVEHTSGKEFVQNSLSSDSAIHEILGGADSKDSQQLIFATGTTLQKDSVAIKSDSDHLNAQINSIQQDGMSISCNTDNLTPEKTLAPVISANKVTADTEDNPQEATFITDSICEKNDTDIASESNNLPPNVDSNEQDVLPGFQNNELTSENVLVSDASSGIISASTDNNSKDFHDVTITDSFHGETTPDSISESDCITVHTDSNQQVVMSMDSVSNELTSENVLVPVVSSDLSSTHVVDNSEDSQQVIYITDPIPIETDAEMLESNDQNLLAINSNTDQLTSEDVLVYVPCEGGYRLCKISTNIDINSKDSQQITFITDSVPQETDSGLVTDSNCYIINTDSGPLDSTSVTDGHTSESVLVPVSDVVFKTIPFTDEPQNTDLKTEENKTQSLNPITDKEDTKSSAGNLTTDEIYDSLDKIFTQTTESDVLYSVPEEQRDVPFDFVGEKMISLSTNVSTEASEGAYTVIHAEFGDNLRNDQLTKSDTVTDLNTESGTYINQEEMMLVDDNQNSLNISVENSGRNQILEGKDNAHTDLCSVNTKKVFGIQPNHFESTEMEICYEKTPASANSDNDSKTDKPIFSEDVKVVYENLSKETEKDSEITVMETTACSNDKNTEINQLLTHFQTTNEVCRNIHETSNISLQKLQVDELGLVNVTHSLGMEIKSKNFLNKQLSQHAETEMSDLKCQNDCVSMEPCLEPQNTPNKSRTSKARKSTSKSSILKPPDNETLMVIKRNIADESFKLLESKENLSNHDNSFVSQEQVPHNLPSLPDTVSDSGNIPLIENDLNINPDLVITAFLKTKSSFQTHFNGKHKNGTAKKSSSKINNRSSDEMSSNCDMQTSVISTDSEPDNVSSEPRKTSRYLSGHNNPEISYSAVEDLQVTHSNLENVKQRSALKTFKKPFTVAKKSVTEKSSYKTVFQSYFGIRTAKKTCNKSSNKKLLNANLDESSSSVEELSADEAKNSTVIWSPVKDLQLKVCSCCAVEVPCLCNGEQLQSICEAEDTIDEKIVLCTKSVSQQYLLTPSSEIKHRAFCDIHLWRLKKHHCCPKCGIFCTQGSFLCCSYDDPVKGEKETHFFHPNCFLVPDTGLPPGCPHCCTFSDFKNVHFSLIEKVPEDTSTQSPNNCSAKYNITEGLENYSILMETQNVEKETVSPVCTTSKPPTQDLKTMLMAITKEPSLRLRPTGKILFNPIKVGDVKKVIQLIANGVDPNHKFSQHKNNTPLHIASFYGSIGIVHVLIQYGATIDAVNDDLETPFILAVEKDQMAVVRYLIHAGAEINVKNENGLTAFHVACKNNSKEMAEFLYNSGKFDINLQDDGGWTPLVWACEHNYGDLVQWLLKHGADPNVRDNEQNTALHWAACSGNSDILEMILDNGCNLSFVNQRGDSALHIAARKDNWACVKLLLARNASLDCTNKDGETPIMCCDEDSISLRILSKHFSTSANSDSKSFQQYVVYRDISRGSEKYPIQAVNEVDQEEFIVDFRYITRSCYASNLTVVSTVDSMQKCYCKDNCISPDCTCTRMSKCWYNMNGSLLSEFDMYDPPSLFECNKTCHCPKTCINRVVQKGLRHPLQLFRTLNRGWGVRTLKDLERGTFVCEYVGEVISEEEINRRTDDTYLFDLESKTGDNCIDGRFYGNIARFINHSCDPNLVSIRVFIEHQDLNFPRIAFFTMKDIKAFEELCFDYGTEFWVAKSQSVLCTCNSSLCKYSKDSIDATLQAYVNDKEVQTVSLMDVQPS